MLNTQSQVISQRTKELINKLILGKLALPQIARITGISEQWLQGYVNANHF
jgi:insertion element IS1 protein InsB